MVESFNCSVLNNTFNILDTFSVNIVKENNENRIAKLGSIDSGNQYDLERFKVDHLKDYICDRKNVAISDIHAVKLWKVNVVKENGIEEDENEMKPQQLFSDCFQYELNGEAEFTVTNIHIIAIIPTSTGKRKAEHLDLDETNVKKEKLVDLSSPESIVRFLTEDDENKKWIKTDFAKPYKLCDNKFDFKREGRDDALYQLYDYIYNRHCGISNAKSIGDKALHPLLALQSAPGGGKSFFFDELASLKSEDIDRYLKKHPERINDEKFEEAINIIRNSIGICITYNSGSLYNENIMDGDIRKGLIMRILWSYFLTRIS